MPATTPTATRPEPPVLRPARAKDAADLARLADLAGEGLPAYLWAKLAEPGEDAFAVGARRVARDEGSFSWRNAVVAEIGGAVAGLLVTYRVGDAPEPLDDLPPIARPLQELENRALGMHYVNILAVYPGFRRRGVARLLLAEAGARGADARGISLIVADRNAPARRLYAACGFREVAEAPMVKENWRSDSDTWVLMVKPAAPGASIHRP
jgi:ribosomal protein S18 acetylase RimI-like enzyme